MFEPTATKSSMEHFSTICICGGGLMCLPTILENRYGENDPLVRRLFNFDQDFASACEDYAAAVTAEKHWQGEGETGKQRASEYAVLAAELLCEIDGRVRQEQDEIKRIGGRNEI